jgi:hypothetical protein
MAKRASGSQEAVVIGHGGTNLGTAIDNKLKCVGPLGAPLTQTNKNKKSADFQYVTQPK